MVDRYVPPQANPYVPRRLSVVAREMASEGPLAEMEAEGRALVDGAAARLAPPQREQGPLPPTIAVDAASNRLYVQGEVFSMDDHARALETEELLTQPGTGLPDEPGWTPISPEAYAEFLGGIRNPTTGRLMSMGWDTGVDQLKQLGGSVLQMVGAEETGAGIVERAGERIRMRSPYVREFTNVTSGEQDFTDWAAYTFATQGPILIETIAAAIVGAAGGTAAGGPIGGVAGALAGVVGRRSFVRNVAASANRYRRARAAGRTPDPRDVTRLRQAGAIAATAANNYAMGVGDIYLEMRERGIDENDASARLAALTAAVPWALAETIPEVLIVGRLLGRGGRTALPDGSTTLQHAREYGIRAGQGIATFGTAEALTEGSQESINMLTASAVGADPMEEGEAALRLVNSMAAGFLIGGGLGGLGNLRSGGPAAQEEIDMLNDDRPDDGGGDGPASGEQLPLFDLDELDNQQPPPGDPPLPTAWRERDEAQATLRRQMFRGLSGSERLRNSQVLTPPRGEDEVGNTVGLIERIRKAQADAANTTPIQSSLNVGVPNQPMSQQEVDARSVQTPPQVGLEEEAFLGEPEPDQLDLFDRPRQGVLQFAPAPPEGRRFGLTDGPFNTQLPEGLVRALRLSEVARAEARRKAQEEEQAYRERQLQIAEEAARQEAAAEAAAEEQAIAEAAARKAARRGETQPVQLPLFTNRQAPRPSRGEALRRGAQQLPADPEPQARNLSELSPNEALRVAGQLPLITQAGKPSVGALGLGAAQATQAAPAKSKGKKEAPKSLKKKGKKKQVKRNKGQLKRELREEAAQAEQTEQTEQTQQEATPKEVAAAKEAAAEKIAVEKVAARAKGKYIRGTKYVFHAVRSDEDIESIMKNGLAVGSNLSFDTEGQAFTEGATILVFRRDAVAPKNKQYQNDGLSTRKAKPVAILKDTSVDAKEATTDEQYDFVANEYEALDARLDEIAAKLKITRDELNKMRWKLQFNNAPTDEYTDTFGKVGEEIRKLNEKEKRIFRELQQQEARPEKSVTPTDVLQRYAKHGIPVVDVLIDFDDDAYMNVVVERETIIPTRVAEDVQEQSAKGVDAKEQAGSGKGSRGAQLKKGARATAGASTAQAAPTTQAKAAAKPVPRKKARAEKAVAKQEEPVYATAQEAWNDMRPDGALDLDDMPIAQQAQWLYLFEENKMSMADALKILEDEAEYSIKGNRDRIDQIARRLRDELPTTEVVETEAKSPAEEAARLIEEAETTTNNETYRGVLAYLMSMLYNAGSNEERSTDAGDGRSVVDILLEFLRGEPTSADYQQAVLQFVQTDGGPIRATVTKGDNKGQHTPVFDLILQVGMFDAVYDTVGYVGLPENMKRPKPKPEKKDDKKDDKKSGGNTDPMFFAESIARMILDTNSNFAWMPKEVKDDLIARINALYEKVKEAGLEGFVLDDGSGRALEDFFDEEGVKYRRADKTIVFTTGERGPSVRSQPAPKDAPKSLNERVVENAIKLDRYNGRMAMIAAAATKSKDSVTTGDVAPGPSNELLIEIITDGLKKRLKDLGIANRVKLEVVRDLFSKNVPGRRIRGKYTLMHKLISIGLNTDGGEYIDTLNHEVIHALKHMGLFTDAEWTTLKRAAKADVALMSIIREGYAPSFESRRRKLKLETEMLTGLISDKDRRQRNADIDQFIEDSYLEEAIAEMFNEWARNQRNVIAGRSKPSAIDRLFEKIMRFFEALGNQINGLGFTTADEVFAQIESGAVGARYKSVATDKTIKLRRSKSSPVTQLPLDFDSMDQVFFTEDNKQIDGPMPINRIKAVTNSFVMRLKKRPKVHVYKDQQELKSKNPTLYAQAVAARPQGDFDSTAAMAYSFTGKSGPEVIVFADSILTPKQLKFVLAHETVGHFGLRSLVPTNQFDGLMRAIYQSTPSLQGMVDANMEENGVTLPEAMEEVLADFAADLDTRLVARIWNAIKNILNAMGVSFGSDHARYVVSLARKYVRNGNVSSMVDAPVIAKSIMDMEYGNDPNGTGRFARAGSLRTTSLAAGQILSADTASPMNTDEALEYLKNFVTGKGGNLADAFDRVASSIFSLSTFRSTENPGLFQMEQILTMGTNSAMAIRISSKEHMRPVLNRAIAEATADMPLVGGITKKQTATINTALVNGMLRAINEVDHNHDETRLIRIDDRGQLVHNDAEINRLFNLGTLTFEQMRDGYSYTVSYVENGKVVKDKVEVPGIKGLTKQSIEWTGYLATRETIRNVELKLLEALYISHTKERELAYREMASVMVNGVMDAKSKQFLDRMYKHYREIYTDDPIVDNDGNVNHNPDSVDRADEFLVALNTALIAEKSAAEDKIAAERNAKVAAFLPKLSAEKLSADIEEFKSKFVRQDNERDFTIQNKVKDLIVAEMSNDGAERFLKNTLSTGYVPLSRRGGYDVLTRAIDVKTGKPVMLGKHYKSQIAYFQTEDRDNAMGLAAQLNEIYADTEYEVEALDHSTGKFEMTKVKLVASPRVALSELAAPPSLNLNEFTQGLRRFGIALAPAKMKKVVTAMTKQNSRMRHRLRREVVQGYDPNTIRSVSEHIDARASTIAKTLMQPHLDELMNLRLKESRDLWYGDMDKLAKLKAKWEEVSNNPNATEGERFKAKSEYHQYAHMMRKTNPEGGLEEGNKYYNEGSRTLQFLETNRDVAESDIGNSKLGSSIRAMTSVMQLGLSFATGILNWVAQYTNALPAMAFYNEKNGFGGGHGFWESFLEMQKAGSHVGIAKSVADPRLNTAEFYDLMTDAAEDQEQAAKLRKKYKLEAHEARFIAWEIRNGVMIPAQTNALMETARGRISSGFWQRTIDGVMWTFNTSERGSRRTTGLAIYRMEYARRIAAGDKPEVAATAAREQSVNIIKKTLGEYSVLNRPAFWRAGVQSFLYIYKIFPTTSILLMKALPAKGRMHMIASLVIMAGIAGLPFAEDIEDLLDTIAQAFGMQRASMRYEAARFLDSMHPGLGGVLINGLGSYVLPADMASRVSLGNFVPGTGALLAGSNVSHEVAEIAGPAWSMLAGLGRLGVNTLHAATRESVTWVDVFREAPMTGARLLGDAVAYTQSGAVVDRRGYVVSPDMNAALILTRLVGFYPAAAANQYSVIRTSKRITDYQREVSAAFRYGWVRAMMQGDRAQAREVEEAVREWNRGARGTALEVRNFRRNANIALREARLPAGARLLRSAPRAARDDMERVANLLGYEG